MKKFSKRPIKKPLPRIGIPNPKRFKNPEQLLDLGPRDPSEDCRSFVMSIMNIIAGTGEFLQDSEKIDTIYNKCERWLILYN